MTGTGDAEPPAVDLPYDLRRPDLDRLRAAVHDWVARQVLPFVDEWETAAAMPRELFQAAGTAGLFGWKQPSWIGGSGPDFLADAVVTQELAGCHSGGVAAALGAHKDLGPYYLWRFGTAEQRRRWVPDCLAGRTIGALAVTEPDAGSDVAGLRTRAVRDGDDWLLNGAKTLITNGDWADLVVVAAITDPDASGHHGMSMFVVERGDRGFDSRRIDTLGWRTSSTGELGFVDVRLPGDRLLGGHRMLNQGFAAIMRNFQWERIGMALAAARAAADTLAAAAPSLPAGVAADLRAEVAATRALSERALRYFVAGRDAVTETSMAKWYACELDVRVAEAAVEAGGWEALAGGRLERRLRDARLGPIGGGTTQVMKEVVGRRLAL